MKFKVNKDTKFADFAPFAEFVSNADLQKLKEAAGISGFNFWELTIRGFSDLNKGVFPETIQKVIEADGLLDVFAIRNAIEKFANDFTAVIQRFELPQTSEEIQAGAGVPEFSLLESMLLFTQKYFSLPSFEAAEQITLSDFLMAKKADYSSRLFERNYTKVMEQKHKLRK
jgi:hypothetical protein